LTLPKECKRLAEVDFPIATVSRHAVREKSIRHGHPSTLHLWWARRPLAACRAVLLALLLPDPCDPHCPDEFKSQARAALQGVLRGVGDGNMDLRQALLRFIGDFANWDLAANEAYLKAGRELVRAAHPEEPPLVVDPFAGGGSIPLEALRLGCEAFASDLNPVACLILKVMLEDIPRHGPELAEEVRRAGAEVKVAAEESLAKFYPPDPDGARPVVYLWTRAVRCEAPNCGAEIPLVRSFWLGNTPRRRRALRYRVVRSEKGPPRVEFDIFQPRAEAEVHDGIVSRARATCPCCGVVLPPERVRAQLAAQRGGADVIFDEQGRRAGGARLLAVVTLQEGEVGRSYRLPTADDYQAVWRAQQRLAEVTAQPLPNSLSPVPDELLPPVRTLGFRVQRYGMEQWSDLFTARQKLAMVTLVQQTASVDATDAIRRVLACALGVFARSCNGNARLRPDSSVAPAFGMQTLPITWTFPETVLSGGRSENFDGAVGTSASVVAAGKIAEVHRGQVQVGDATASPLPGQTASVWFTDPPYYDAVPYADLSDFFFVWLKRALPGHPLLRDPFDAGNQLTPKAREAVQDEIKRVNGRPKDRAFFEETMGRAFAEGRRVLKDDGVGCVVFAHKTTAGWEALLSGMIHGGWIITGSWPIATESSTRLRARDSAALATSVHLVCRPRPAEAPVGDWEDVLRALPRRVGDWMERLQGEGVRGADLVFACIGPALEIYSRYSKVVDAEEREIPLGGDPEATEPHRRGYLAYVWEVVGRAALEQVLGTAEAAARNGAAGVLEEDARLTALFLWTLQSTDGQADAGDATGAGEEEEDAGEEEEKTPRKKAAGYRLVYDVARRFAQPLGIHLSEWEGRIIETEKGVVRLLPVAERAKQLFGEESAGAVATDMEERSFRGGQLALFPEMEVPQVRGRGRKAGRALAADVSDEALHGHREATTLDRIHAAMLLQKAGRANALRALLEAEQDRGPDFLRLANALSALYPRGSEEKRLLDAMLLAVPR